MENMTDKQAYAIGYKVGLSGTIALTLPAYPPLPTIIRKAWQKGWKDGHRDFVNRKEV